MFCMVWVGVGCCVLMFRVSGKLIILGCFSAVFAVGVVFSDVVLGLAFCFVFIEWWGGCIYKGLF